MGGAVTLKSPDFHFSKSLASELGFSSQRLLSDKRVRSDRTHVNLILNHVDQFHKVSYSDGAFLGKGQTSFAVIELNLAIFRQTRLFKFFFYGPFGRTSHSRSGYLVSQLLGGDSKMSFKNLADIHTGYNTQRRQHNIYRSPV